MARKRNSMFRNTSFNNIHMRNVKKFIEMDSWNCWLMLVLWGRIDNNGEQNLLQYKVLSHIVHYLAYTLSLYHFFRHSNIYILTQHDRTFIYLFEHHRDHRHSSFPAYISLPMAFASFFRSNVGRVKWM